MSDYTKFKEVQKFNAENCDKICSDCGESLTPQWYGYVCHNCGMAYNDNLKQITDFNSFMEY